MTSARNTNILVRSDIVGEDILLEDGDIDVVLSSSFTPELVHLFDTTLWGDNGGAQYEHKDTAAHLEEMQSPVIATLRLRKELVGVCVLVGRDTAFHDKIYDTHYIRYLVSSLKYRGRGITTKYAIECIKALKNRANEEMLLVGTVEEFNKRSYQLVSASNLEKSSTIRTMVYSRFFPKRDARVQQMKNEDDLIRIKQKLDEQYTDHALFHTDNIGREGNFYYIEEKGEIIAGLQCFKARWVIKKLPGWSGKVLIRILPYIPIVNQVFNPRKFEFLAIEGLIYKPDRIADLHRLISDVLSRFHRKTAMFWLDENAQIARDLVRHGRLGILQNMGAASKALIMIGYTHIDDKVKQEFKEAPFYQSAYDFI